MRNTSDGGLVVVAAMIAFCMSAAPSINAQPYKASVVHVVLTGCGDEVPELIRVVPDNDETRSFLAKRDGVSNVWKAEPGTTFNANGRIASLRAGQGRTACAKSIHVPAPKDGAGDWIAQYTFACDFAPAWKLLTIDNDAGAMISTVRDMPGLPGALPCKEKWLQRQAPRQIDAVAWRQEAIYVQFGEPGKLSYEYYDMVIRKNGVFAGKPVKDELVVKRAVVLKQQVIRGGRGAASNAATIRDDFNLDASVKTVTLKRVE